MKSIMVRHNACANTIWLVY